MVANEQEDEFNWKFESQEMEPQNDKLNEQIERVESTLLDDFIIEVDNEPLTIEKTK